MQRQVGLGAPVGDTVWDSKSTQPCRGHPFGGRQVFSVVRRGGALISCVYQIRFLAAGNRTRDVSDKILGAGFHACASLRGSGERWEI